MTEKMKTVCVGRFLVDVPADAQVSLSREMIDGFGIETIEEGETAFRARVAAREAELAAGPGAGAASGPAAGPAARIAGALVEARDLRVPGLIGRILVFGRTRSHAVEDGRRVDDEWVSVETHAHTGELSVTLSMQYADEPDARKAEALLARLQPRGEDEIPATPGFCVWRAVFAEPLPPHGTEHVTMHIGFPDHPDVALAFASLPGGARERTLLARVADTDAAAGADELLRVTRLRAGRRDINGIDGDEVLERVRELNFTTGYGFIWEAQGVKDSLAQPFLSLELQGGISPRPGGKPVDTSLHEDAVMALWQRISASIRLRPSGPPPGAAAAGPAAPPPSLGAVVHAGESCPRSGWWRCSEGGPGVDVRGGSVQYLRKGEPMPQALLLPHQTMWQKLRGVQPSIAPTRRSAWTLVDQRQRPRTPALVALAPALMAAGTPAPAIPPGIGCRARSGDVCPASGWWRCEESLALDGARWFPHGSVLPPATFQVPAGRFERAGERGAIQRRSSWELMRLADAAAASTPVGAAAAPEDAPTARPPSDAPSDGPAALT